MNSMKVVLAMSLLAGTYTTLSAQTAFKVKGDFKDTSRNGEQISLVYFNGEKKMYTSAIVQHGVFEIEGTVKDPARAALSIATTKKERAVNPWVMNQRREFFIEGGLITIEGAPLEKAVVKAPGQSQKDLVALQAILKPYEDRSFTAYMDMIKAATDKDSIGVKKYTAIRERCHVQMDSIELAWMKSHPRSHVALGMLRQQVTSEALSKNKPTVEAWYDKLPDSLKKTVLGKQIDELIQKAGALAPGKPAGDFVLNDTLGNPVKLSSFRGKYVLLDFWASWCIPCRAENPTVIKAYERFKNKNFEVISVSLEKPGDRAAWVKAIVKDKLTWVQVAPLTTAEHDVVTKLYGIQSIPMNFLIDPKGNIVATYLRGEELIKKLEQVL